MKRLGPKRFALTLAVLLLLLPAGISAQNLEQLCQQSCEEQNIPASCAWLSKQQRRCVQRAIKACVKLARLDLGAVCNPPEDLPVCLTNQGCPHGSMCVSGVCQVVACTGSDGLANCTGDNTCVGERCLVNDCRASDQNCPAGSHCEPADPPFGSISGTCQPNDPDRRQCTTDTDCITAGSFNLRCFRGVCAVRRERRQCENDGDCFRVCKTSPSAVRIPRCDAAGRCACANCSGAAQCNARFSCVAGSQVLCRTNGPCFCPPVPPPPPPGGTGVCTTFETPRCTPCETDADCIGIDACLQSARCG